MVPADGYLLDTDHAEYAAHLVEGLVIVHCGGTIVAFFIFVGAFATKLPILVVAPAIENAAFHVLRVVAGLLGYSQAVLVAEGDDLELRVAFFVEETGRLRQHILFISV